MTKRKQVKVGALTYAQLVLHMLEGVYNCQELAEMTGLHYVTVLQYTRELHAAGAAHICAWEKDQLGRDSIKIYKLGKGRNVRREKLSPAQRAERYRAKRNAIEMLGMTTGRGKDRTLESAFGAGGAA